MHIYGNFKNIINITNDTSQSKFSTKTKFKNDCGIQTDQL